MSNFIGYTKMKLFETQAATNMIFKPDHELQNSTVQNISNLSSFCKKSPYRTHRIYSYSLKQQTPLRIYGHYKHIFLYCIRINV